MPLFGSTEVGFQEMKKMVSVRIGAVKIISHHCTFTPRQKAKETRYHYY